MSTSLFHHPTPSSSASTSFASTSFASTSSAHNNSDYDYSRPREPSYHASSSSSAYASSSSPPSHLHSSSSRPPASSPTHSSSSSISSHASRSPMFSGPEAPPERGRTPVNGNAGAGARTPRSQDGSVGSLATTVSSGVGSPGRDEPHAQAGKDVVMQEADGEGRREGAPTRDIAALSVRDDRDGEGEGAELEKKPSADGSSSSFRSGSNDSLAAPDASVGGGAGTGKTRRASVLSSSSSSTAQTTPAAEASSAAAAEGGESRSGRRKAARMGSFYGGGGDSTLPSEEAAAETEHETEQEQETAANTSPTAHHVDIVSYPSADLLRLLAALLEQIAQANDERNARNASASAGPTSAPSAAAPNPPTAPAPVTPAAAAATTPDPSSRRSSVDENWEKGRFDAAPLNTPVTARFKKPRRKLGGAGGPGILDNALDEDGEEEGQEEEEEEDEDDYSLPLTPGVDLLRETGDRGGVEGFMPSLGGTHRPQPLSRRRGSSFIRNKRNEDGTVPVLSRRGTSQQQQPGGGVGSFSSGGSGSAALGPAFSTSASSSSSSSPANAPPSSSATPVRPPPQPTASASTASHSHSSFTTYQSGSLSSSEPPLTSLLTASAIALSSPSATLCFHARNVPAISIEAYLQRILKYCPTTNEVFLALLVYFDRMARIGLEARRMGLPRGQGGAGAGGAGGGGEGQGGAGAGKDGLFAIDSFNVHRLVIAGVTVASKFFSDVFYTNSRYAKVGGLPLHELNQLELQFLLLNDFRLKIPTDELQRYADQLILYWVGRNGTSNPQAAASLSGTASGATTPARRQDPPPASQQQQQQQPVFKSPFAANPAPTPSASGTISQSAPPPPSAPSSSSTTRPAHPSRSNPSHSSYASSSSHSSGASVSSSVSSSTVTPGTPSTTRTVGSASSRSGSFGGSSSDEEEVGEDGNGERGRGGGEEGEGGEGEKMETD
ncbi:hypothetical protein JCM6882_004335 [Rhodosporidiobolus microsporus]